MSTIRCRHDSPIRCDGRASAMARQDFIYVWGWGWVWWQSANPTVPWVKCPWCDGALPNMEAIVERGVREGFDAMHLDNLRQADGVVDEGEGPE